MASPTFSNTEDKDNYQEERRLPQSDVYVNLNNLVISQIGLDLSTKRRHFLLRLQTFIKENLIKRHNNFWKRTILVALLVIYFIYFGFAIHHNAAGALPLIIITSLVLVYAIYRALAFLYGYYLKTNIISPSYKWIQSNLSSVKWWVFEDWSSEVNVVNIPSKRYTCCFCIMKWTPTVLQLIKCSS